MVRGRGLASLHGALGVFVGLGLLAVAVWVPVQLWPAAGSASGGAAGAPAGVATGVYGRVASPWPASLPLQAPPVAGTQQGKASGAGTGDSLQPAPMKPAAEATPPATTAGGATDAEVHADTDAQTSAQTPAAAACDLLLPRLPGLTRSQCLATRLQASGARSAQGRPLYWRDVRQTTAQPRPHPRLQPVANGTVSSEAVVGGAAVDAAPLRVLVVGAMHGDELTAATLALRWIAMAEAEDVAHEGAHPPAHPTVHWRFVPVLNPDGLLAPKPTRVNASGVDLNRNFPTPGWAQEAPAYWEKRTRKDPRRWPGPEPLSEPESRFLHQQMDQFRPQLVVSIHAPYGVLDFDGPHDPPARLGRLRMDKLGVFPGSLGHYGGLHRGVPVVTIELEHALRMPPDAEVRAMWRDLRQWMNTRLVLDGQGL
ncbi:murein peptide amidase A [Acidovorax sp. DW039]|uniref:M14 family zinc carboxypeptidase n=1 Tax=Acidovorax sp. DW039 TaxID=3095606 RepID=UPI00308684A4|nr:murein peptide amidase A [Acidovorax sp. DW039]